MSNNQDLISVIVPCYNQSRYLEDNVKSICRDAHKNIEIVIVNDGSTDADYALVEQRIRAVAGHCNLHVINQQNGGLSCARNTGIAQSKGKYIQLLDADDMIVNSKLSQQIAVMKEEQLDISLCNYMMCNSDRSQFWSPDEDTIEKFDFDFRTLVSQWERGYSIPIHCGLFKRELLLKVGFETGLPAKEDWIFWLGLSIFSPKVAFQPIVGAIYRQHRTGMTKNLRKMGVDWLGARDHIKSKFPDLLKPDDISSINDHFTKFYFRHFWLKYGSSLPDIYFGKYFEHISTEEF